MVSLSGNLRHPMPMRSKRHPLTLYVTGSPGTAEGRLTCELGEFPAQLGRAGVLPMGHDPAEGDGATPLGTFSLRQVLFRADRRTRPVTGLPVIAIHPNDHWCDDPDHVLYNRPVSAPFPARTEALWRPVRSYDICIVLDFNLTQPTPGQGSAIFFHLTRTEDHPPPTEGCVAVAPDVMDELLPHLGIGSTLTVASA